MPLLRQEQYDALLEAYRKNPENHSAVEQSTRITRKTARAVWAFGIPRRGLPPIKDVVAREAEEEKEGERAANRARGVERDQKRAAAHQDAVDQQARELQAARSTLSAALSNLAVLGQLSSPILALARRVAAQLDQEEKVEVPAAMAVLREYGVISARASLVAKRAVEIGRLLVGEPGKIIGHQHSFRTAAEAPPVFASRALEAFGGSEEAVKEAARDLFEGRMTEGALRLIESQALEDQDPRARS